MKRENYKPVIVWRKLLFAVFECSYAKLIAEVWKGVEMRRERKNLTCTEGSERSITFFLSYCKSRTIGCGGIVKDR